MSLNKASTKRLIEELVREELNETGLGDFLTKDLFAKAPQAKKQEQRLEAEQRVRALFSDIARTLATVPQDLEGKIRTLRDIKEKISQALIWDKPALLDLLDKASEKE
jgi:hypothetical protein|tara:strand:+ start:298 stop:621 length:324 start_codon:yes stop_codon:yes gene_type:complete